MINKKTIIIIVLFLLLFFIVIPYIILKESYIGIFEKDTALSYLAYTGSIIGGLLTLAGVSWTILDQSKKRKEELSIQYAPIMYANIHSLLNEKGENIPIIDLSNDPITIHLGISLLNQGRGEIIALKLICFEIVESTDNIKIETPNFFHYIPVGNYEVMPIKIYNITNLNQKIVIKFRLSGKNIMKSDYIFDAIPTIKLKKKNGEPIIDIDCSTVYVKTV